jgi:hypothetical protein
MMNLKKYGMTVPKTQMTFIGTSRRGGKTDIMTMCAAAILACVPYARVLYFSIFDKTCEVACNTVYQWLVDWGMRARIHSKSSLKITVYGDSPEDIRSMIFINGQSENVSHTYYIYIYLCIGMNGDIQFILLLNQ